MDSGRALGPRRSEDGVANGPDCFRLSVGDGFGNAHLRLPDRFFSSRKIETAAYDSIAFRFIAGNTHPDHRSLSAFRKRFQGEFKKLFLRGSGMILAQRLRKIDNPRVTGRCDHSLVDIVRLLSLFLR